VAAAERGLFEVGGDGDEHEECGVEVPELDRSDARRRRGRQGDDYRSSSDDSPCPYAALE